MFATENSSPLKFREPSSKYSLGIDYIINENFILGASFERGNFFSLKFVYKNNPKQTLKKYEYQKPEINKSDNKYTKLIKNLEKNGIGVNKITETTRSIGLDLTQFVHPDLKLVEQIISQATTEAGINKNVKKDLKIANLTAVTEIDDSFNRNAQTIYQRDEVKMFFNCNQN